MTTPKNLFRSSDQLSAERFGLMWSDIHDQKLYGLNSVIVIDLRMKCHINDVSVMDGHLCNGMREVDAVEPCVLI